MIKYFAVIISMSLTLVGTAQSYTLLKNESTITWTGYGELGAYSQSGSIDFKDAKLILDNGQLSTASAQIDMTSISHEDKNLSKHLKNEDFFDVKKYPRSRLALISVEGNMVNAALEIKGVKEVIQFPVELIPGKGRLTLLAELSVDRTKYGIKYNSSSFFQDLGSYAIENLFDLKIKAVFEEEN